MSTSLKYTQHQYGVERDLQRLGVWHVDSESKSKTWIIYIHGGAWRDPRITHQMFAPTIDVALSSDSLPMARIAAFASIDYRLSPHPGFPQDPATTPGSEYRDAQHSDHLDDVRSGIAYLQKTYGFGGNYILVGHSAGACLAFQLLAQPQHAGSKVVLPQIVIGIAGIYDFAGIASRLGDAYTQFLTAAFGGDAAGWDEAAPMKSKTNYGDKWKGKATLAWSKDDQLVDEPEIDGMSARLERDGVRHSVDKGVQGNHDLCWERGVCIARLISACF
ncbi:alpha/beta-hydrolase [Xylariaceae sp. FL0016]|nr:alpha/beta-hydrolase [Xylariaceae sp. FL0016]